MNKYTYDNKLACYSDKQLDAYATMIRDAIGENIHVPGHFQMQSEDFQNRVRDINREKYLREHRQ